MTAKLLLPVAIVSALALAACEERATAPEVPNPDAGNPEAFAEPVEEDVEVSQDDVLSPAELERRREEIEQEAQQTFQSIIENTQQTGEDLTRLGNEAMDSISEGVGAAADSLDSEIDALVQGATEFRDENLTEAQRRDIVQNVRNSAEQAARALGRTEAEITAAGNTAEERARQTLGVD